MSLSEGRADLDRGGRTVKLADFFSRSQEKGLATSKRTSANCWNQAVGHNERELSARGRCKAMQRDARGTLTFSTGEHQESNEEDLPFKGINLVVFISFSYWGKFQELEIPAALLLKFCSVSKS